MASHLEAAGIHPQQRLKLQCEYFNPVVEDWTPDCQEEERWQRAECDVLLYVITPLMTGVYSIAEAVEDSIKNPEKTVFCIKPVDEIVDLEAANRQNFVLGHPRMFTEGQLRSLNAVGEMVQRNGGCWRTWGDLAVELNSRIRYPEEE